MINEIKKFDSFPLGSIVPNDLYSRNAVKKEFEYLSAFDIDRVLAGFYKNAGIETSFEPYGGWESLLIGGHAVGHYITALAQASVYATAPENEKAALKTKLNQIIDGLYKAQLPNGFLWGAQILDQKNPEIQFDNLENGKTDMFKEAWVPWYTMHKILEGLIAAYEIAGLEKALEIAKKLGDWVCSRALSWDEKTRKTVLATEYGGMNDIMYELYRCTEDERYAAAAHVFDEESFFDDILTNRKNLLLGKHANTNIPKVIGALRRYQIMGQKVDCSRYLEVAKVFWDNVISHHTYHTGGNSEWEHFRDDDCLNKNRTNANCETCNVYNMLKLTKELFKITGERKYADYLENAYINHILASQNPDTGMTTYFQAMATGYFKVYSSPWDDFWCCTGSGMENFTKLGECYAFSSHGTVTVLTYMPFTLKTAQTEITLDRDVVREGKTVLKITSGEKIRLRLRIPNWCSGIDDMEILLNGFAAGIIVRGGFAEIEMPLSKGDKIEIRIRCALKVLTLPDSDNTVAFRYGHFLLAACLGNKDMETYRSGVAVAFAKTNCSDGVLKLGTTVEELKRFPDRFLKRTGDIVYEAGELRFIPYYLIKDRYGIYWNIE